MKRIAWMAAALIALALIPVGVMAAGGVGGSGGSVVNPPPSGSLADWSAASNSLLETQQGYIKDMWVDYWTTNTLSIWPGSAMSAGKYVACSTTSYITVNTMTRSNEIQYVYLNQRASSFAGCSFYAVTNVPIYATNTWWGWYSPVTNTDRCVGWAQTYTNSYNLTTFSRSWNGEAILLGRSCGFNMNPNGTYQTPTPYQTSVFLGVTASEGLFLSRAGYSATDAVLFEAVPSEYQSLTHAYQYISDTQLSDWNASFWLRLGPSKNVLIKGNNLNANALSLVLYGYKEIR